MRILMTAMMFLAASASLILQAPSAWSVMQSSDAAISGLPEREELLYKVKWL